MKTKYGMSEMDYQRLLKIQNFECAICKSITPGQNRDHFCVDHDHKTGRVRGLLCDTCNKGLGFFKDDIELCKNSVEYLYKYV